MDCLLDPDIGASPLYRGFCSQIPAHQEPCGQAWAEAPVLCGLQGTWPWFYSLPKTLPNLSFCPSLSVPAPGCLGSEGSGHTSHCSLCLSVL